MRVIDRRGVLSGLAAGVGLFGLGTGISADPVYKKIEDLKPGEFTWHPERSPEGPVAIIVSIPEQRVFVYRNGIRIGVSTCSTGKPGHETPTGVFTILEKDKNHHSSTYNDAPMPNMNRLTWNGVALHAGNLPGYPASHGCVRLPVKFSEVLFGVTHVGTPVILAGSHTDPKEVTHPGLVLSDYAESEFISVQSNLKGEKLPWQTEVVKGETSTSIIVSHGDMTITVLENGKTVASGPATITNPSTPLGRHVFMLIGAHEGRQGLTWHAITHHDQTGIPLGQPDEAVLQRIKADDQVRTAIADRMHPGMVLITTELPSHPDTRSGEDFVLMDTGQSS
jgi:L,D-transpeptidase catalytic domain